MRLLRAPLRLLLLVSTILLVPVSILLVFVASCFGRRARYAVILWATPLVCRTYLLGFGVRLSVEGHRRGDVKIFVGNHLSYLDIFIAGTAVAGVFVSRHDVKHWPIVGWLARIGGTIFLDRGSLRSASESSTGILERVRANARVTLFPEGGILPGAGVKAFKPLLLMTVAAAELPVQPFGIRYDRIDGRAWSPALDSFVRWGDESLPKHVWRLLGLRGVHASVRFGDPIVPRGTGADAARRLAADLREAVEGLGAR